MSRTFAKGTQEWAAARYGAEERIGLPIKMKLTLGLSVALVTSALADTTYKIKEGDTIEVIAKRTHARQRSILSYNGLKANSILRVGRTLIIPTSGSKSDASPAKSVSNSFGTYTVRNGDHDWTIAKKLGISHDQLKAWNPNIKWSRLQVGTKLKVSGGVARVAVSTASKSESKPMPKASGTYAVKEGENDWLIARRFNTTPKVLRQLNPGLNWSRVQIGSKIRVPGSVVASKSSAPRLKSRYAVVTGDDVTIRRGPSTGADSITTVDSGTRVAVLDRDGDWYRLRFPKGTEGWMRSDFLKSVSAPERVATARKAKKVSPSKPTRVAKAGRNSNEDAGSMTQEVVAMQQTGGTVSKLLTKARSMRNVRYRWGSASRSGTDCSGYTTQVFKSNGISLPRTSAEQSRVGTKVSRSALKPGDLVFFRTVRGTRVSHVGIYMGNGKFMHASSGRGKVTESSLSDPYYNNRYVTARRLVKSKKSPKQLVQDIDSLPTLPALDGISETQSENSTVQSPDEK